MRVSAYGRRCPAAAPATEELKPFMAAEFGRLSLSRAPATRAKTGSKSSCRRRRAGELWDALAAAGVRPCGLGARDTLRLEAGMNLYGQDMDEGVNPLESGLAWTVDLASARDFVGKAALAAGAASDSMLGLLLVDKGGVLRSHQHVHSDRGDGEITSGTFSPTLGASIALARLPAGVAPGDPVRVDIRDKQLAARVVKPPFVRHGKILVE